MFKSISGVKKVNAGDGKRLEEGIQLWSKTLALASEDSSPESEQIDSDEVGGESRRKLPRRRAAKVAEAPISGTKTSSPKPEKKLLGRNR